MFLRSQSSYSKRFLFMFMFANVEIDSALQVLRSEQRNSAQSLDTSHQELLTHLGDYDESAAGSAASTSVPASQANGDYDESQASTSAPKKRYFRYRMRDIYRSAAWSEDGLSAYVPVNIIEEQNADIKKPLTSMRKRMVTRGFAVKRIGEKWEIYHPQLNASNWERELFNF